MAITRLGDCVFINCTGPADGPRRHLEVEARAGVDGHALWDLGRRGEPFEAQSVVDVATLYDGIAELRLYESLVGGPPVNFRWAGEFEQSFKVEILSVRRLQLKKLVLGHGGVRNGQCLLRCQWTLLAVI